MSSWWREWATEAGLDVNTSDAGELCLNEAVANIILYDDHPEPGDHIEITLEQSDAAAIMTIVDSSAEFNPLEHRDPSVPDSIEETPEGGRGIPLIRQFSSEAGYRRQDGRNVLTLTFRLRDK
jgi:anti-sigma regulatory factor (Ser/Thr protein kinase)